MLSVDFDECSSPDFNDCDEEFAVCINTDGSFMCACNSGFTGIGTNDTCEGNQFRVRKCCVFYCVLWSLDIDECAMSPCDGNAMCLNEIGSFECSCSPGYVGDGFRCSKIIVYIIRGI